MEGKASAPAAGTILNALATGEGAAFAIEEYTTATVSLAENGQIEGEITEESNGNTQLIERCVELVVDRYGQNQGGTVRTESEVPMAAGLKSSSAAANATVLAALSALDRADVSRKTAARIGVQAARDVGVTITGAFDDASASMLGGVTITNNEDDTLLTRESRDWDVLIWTPPKRAYSAEADTERCRQIAPLADLVAELAKDGQFERAMTVNGLAFCGALGFSADPIIDALPDAAGVSLSGTGPSFVAVGTETSLQRVEKRWRQRDGTTWHTTTQSAGARIDE